MTARRRRSRGVIPALPALACLVAGGCTHHVKVEPITVEPIFITLDVRLTVDRELDEFFDFEDTLPAGDAAPSSPTAQDQGGST